jgi:ubiquinone/menaquinone biosynthesis C-methylase UbiE
MYGRSVEYYDALYSFKDYDAAVATLQRTLERVAPDARTLLDVACGTGMHVQRLEERYEVEGLDINPQMLKIARSRCPDVPFHEGDMAEFELPRRFDVVTCLFSSIAYVRTVNRLASAIDSMRRHLQPGGVILLEPWFTPEQFWTRTITANHVDRKDLKITWMYTSEREGALAILDMHYLVGRPEGVESFRERHELGLFSSEQVAAAFVAAELSFHYEPDGPFGRGLYVATA